MEIKKEVLVKEGLEKAKKVWLETVNDFEQIDDEDIDCWLEIDESMHLDAIFKTLDFKTQGKTEEFTAYLD